MKAVFSPAVGMLNRMRYPAKFTLLGLIAFLVVGFLLVQLALSLRTDITFTQKELTAMDSVPGVLKVIELMQQHRGLSSGVLNGNEELRPRLQKKTEEVVAAVAAAESVLSADAAPSASKRWVEVKAGWEAIHSGGLQMPPRENLQAHTAMIRKMVLTLHDLGDDGNLALDPSPDTYYLIDNMLRRVPDVSERLGRLRALGTGVLAAKNVDEQRRFDISSQLGELNMAVTDLNENFERGGSSQPPHQGDAGYARQGIQRGHLECDRSASEPSAEGRLRNGCAGLLRHGHQEHRHGVYQDLPGTDSRGARFACRSPGRIREGVHAGGSAVQCVTADPAVSVDGFLPVRDAVGE